MIVYVDTSALVPLVIAEPSSAACGELWDSADRVATTRLAYVEAVAALGTAERRGRISATELRRARLVLDQLWSSVDVIEVDVELMSVAADLAVTHGLRGYDATHCAAALAIRSDDLVCSTGDKLLLAAWSAEGVAVHDCNSQ